jgi:hypothetical protein
MVLYISPDTFGTGTILHNEKFFEHTQLIWKQNRALIFSIEPPGITSQYHGAVNKTNNPRLTMLFNIYDMTLQSNIDDASFFGDLKTFSSFMKIK